MTKTNSDFIIALVLSEEFIHLYAYNHCYDTVTDKYISTI